MLALGQSGYFLKSKLQKIIGKIRPTGPLCSTVGYILILNFTHVNGKFLKTMCSGHQSLVQFDSWLI